MREGQRRGGGGSPARVRAAAAMPWWRRTPPESGTGAGALCRGLAGAGPAQFGGGRERRERAVLGFGLAQFEEFFLTERKKKRNKI